MQQLSPLDAQFLNVEDSTNFGHVGTLVVLDPSTAPGGELRLEDLRDLLEARLHLAHPLRRRLVQVPLGLARPYWVEDPGFDLEFHVRDIALPPPGDDQQLAEQVARIHARPLDRTRPLWETYLIHGVADGRQAIYAKVHHAAIDGISGAEVLAAIMDHTVEPSLVDRPEEPWEPGTMPSRLELLQRGVAGLVLEPVELLRAVPKALPYLADLPGAMNLPGARAISDLSASVVRLATNATTRTGNHRELTAPRTPLNGPVTAHRRFSFGALPLAEVKRVKNEFGLTVNDVVMAICTSVLRRWLLDHDALPQIPIVVAVPVSVRTGDGGDAGNQISVMLASMPTNEADPQQRLQLVREAMIEAKQQFDEVPATILQDASAVIPTALSGLAARALFRMVTAPAPPFNLFVSNVPGPQLPLYVGGARALGIYPVSAVTDLTGALNITLFSYDGALDFGLVACREIVPDVWNLIGYLRDALDELLALIPAED
jgi:diacylglycerol O-acyltransferase